MGGIGEKKAMNVETKIDSWPRAIMHVDMDAFFAAIEIRNDPKLKGKPVIVGGDPRFRSVVSTCSYEARKYGVKSGMPMAQARRICPEAIVISGNLSEYIYTSAKLQTIFEKYAPIVEPFSVDEVFMDITGVYKIFGGAEELVKKMKGEIKKELSLTCSVGVSPNKLLAKMGSGMNKPDGLTFMDKEGFKIAFFPRPVESLLGVGEATKRYLNEKRVFTVGDLYELTEKELRLCFGENGSRLYKIVRGEDDSEVFSYNERPDDKSMSHETTLNVDLTDVDRIYSTLLWLSEKVARRLRIDNYWGRTISVKARSSDFKTVTRDKTLAFPTDQGKVIYETARRLLPREYGPRVKVRLLGVRVSHLEKKGGGNQLAMMADERGEKIKNCSRTIDIIKDKFGESSIFYAGAGR
jgi:DNA polymerase-4